MQLGLNEVKPNIWIGLDCFTIPRMNLLIKTLLALTLAAMSIFPGWAMAGRVNIAAASDLKFALEEVAQAFQKNTGQGLSLSFGSSGTFATQIRHGAPFQLFLSADEHYVLMLHQEGLTADDGVLYALGRIAIVAPAGSALTADGELKSLTTLIKANKLKRFAIANPEHAPYGQRAEEALRHAGLWEAIRPNLVYGENVSQAAQFALSGSADGGIIALSLAKSPQMASHAQYALIPADWHTPLKQRMVLLKNAGAVAKAFYDYLQQPAARAVLARYGFTLPNKTE